MPKSKRTKLITLSRTEAKGKPGKNKLIENIRNACEEYHNVYVFSLHNVRTSKLKEVRQRWLSSRFFFGKNKVMQIALGRTGETEAKENLHQVAEQVIGNCGLFFTNDPRQDVEKFFKVYSELDFARAGFTATETVVLPEGPCDKFVHSMEAYLRTKLGLPTSLKKGIVHIDKEYTVCNEGDVLTPEQSKLLKLLGVKMSIFSMQLVCAWEDGKFTMLKEAQADNNNNDEDEDDENGPQSIKLAESAISLDQARRIALQSAWRGTRV